MQINITGHQLEVTEAMRNYVEEKLSRLEKRFDKVISAQVIMGIEKLDKKVDATVKLAGGELFASAENADMYVAIDALVDKLDRQLMKFKEKHAQK